MQPVTDPEILRQLNGNSQPVTDPDILAQLNAKPEMTWGQVAEGAAENFIPNAVHYGESVVDMAMNPIDSFMAITKFLGGGLQEALPEGLVQMLGEDKEARDMFNGFVEQIKTDYGSMEGFKRALAERPVEVMSDLSVPFSAAGLAKKFAGGAAPAGRASNAANAVIKAGEMLDPINAVTSAAGKAVGATGSAVLGMTTGVGNTPIEVAFKTGAQGGDAAEDFRTAMRTPEATFQETVNRAKSQLSGLREARSRQYKADMQKVGQSAEIIKFDGIYDALKTAELRVKFKDAVTDPGGAEALRKATEMVSEWQKMGDAYHTAEGIDALKQQVGVLMEGFDYGSNTYNALNGVYNAIKNEIVSQAPVYARAMKSYSDATETIREIEKTMSLGPNATLDTSLRKLQSLMRDNVSTNYGARKVTADKAAQYGPSYEPLVAGQSLNAAAPRGLGRVVGGSSLLYGMPQVLQNPALAAPLAAGAALTSPRLVGEAAHALGRSVGVPKKVIDAALSKLPKGGQNTVMDVIDAIGDPIVRNVMYQSLYAQGDQTNE